MVLQKDKKQVNHGQLLYDLYIWTGLNQDEFTTKFKRSRQWFTLSKDLERLSEKVRASINFAYGISEKYWKGEESLPERKNIAQEDFSPYITINDALRKENEQLKIDLAKAQAKIIELYDRLEKAGVIS